MQNVNSQQWESSQSVLTNGMHPNAWGFQKARRSARGRRAEESRDVYCTAAGGGRSPSRVRERLRRRDQGRPGPPGRPPPEHSPAHYREANRPRLSPSLPQTEWRRGTREVAPWASGQHASAWRRAEADPRPLSPCSRPLPLGPAPPTRLPPCPLLTPPPRAYGSPRETEAPSPLLLYSLLTRDLGKAVGREGSRRRTKHGGGGGGDEDSGGYGDGSGVEQVGGDYSVQLSGGKSQAAGSEGGDTAEQDS